MPNNYRHNYQSHPIWYMLILRIRPYLVDSAATSVGFPIYYGYKKPTTVGVLLAMTMVAASSVPLATERRYEYDKNTKELHLYFTSKIKQKDMFKVNL